MAELTRAEVDALDVVIYGYPAGHTPEEIHRGGILKLREDLMELEPRPHAGPYDRRTDVRKKDQAGPDQA